MKFILSLLLFFSFNAYAIEGLLVKTTDYTFKEKWNNTLGASTPFISSFDKIYRYQTCFITVIAGQYAWDKDDQSEAEYSIKILKPDQSIHFEEANLPLLKGKFMHKDNLQMSDAILEVSFNGNDPLGKYTMEVVITDKISGKTKELFSDITVVELEPYKVTSIDNEGFGNWMTNYYKNPTPEVAVANYVYYVNSSLSEDDSKFFPIFSFFLEIAKNNKFIGPQVIECYYQQDMKTRIFLLYLITYGDLGTPSFYKSLENAEKVAYDQLKENQFPDCYGTISDPNQLDMLWSTFMANGSYQPIFKLIQTLEYTKYQGALEKFKKSKQTEEDRQKALNNAIYDATVWSLKSNCKQHTLVQEYCNWALQFAELTTSQKSELGKLLKELK